MMKKMIIFLFLSFLTISAQPFTISYSVTIDNCDNSDSFEIMSGTMQEGESFTFQTVNLPTEYSSAQFLYNIFVGAEFGIPTGSLTEDIDLKINMGDFWCNFGILEQPEGVFRLFSLYFEITGENSGYNPDLYYWFEENKEAFIKLNLDNITFFLNLLKITDPNDIKVFYVNEEGIDQNAIRKEIIGNNFIIYPQHFSLLSAGIVEGTTNIKDDGLSLQNSYSLRQNHPNPFNPSTTINYTIEKSGFTKLSVYNAIGEEIRVLVNKSQSAGKYSINFNAVDLPSGLYFYSLTSGNYTKTNKMILLK
jgi:hypothetical protein